MPRRVRVKTGCFKCRTRKKKCDERRPVCTGCERNHLDCVWPSAMHSVPKHPYRQHSHTTGAAPGEYDHGSTLSNRPITPSTPPNHSPQINRHPQAPDARSDIVYEKISVGSSMPRIRDNSRGSTSSQWDVHESSDLMYGNIISHPSFMYGQKLTGDPRNPPDNRFTYVDENEIQHQQESPNQPRTPGVLSPSESVLYSGFRPSWGSCGEQDFHLLGHYLTRTAVGMYSGFTVSNPFLTQLMPLALSNHLIFQLLLAQSAVHRAIAHDIDSEAMAQSHYHTSLALFQHNCEFYMLVGNTEKLLPLGVGALIFCFTEAVKGDEQGDMFKHLFFADRLLPLLLNRVSSQIPRSLQNFIVEYYIYTATVSLISRDPATLIEYAPQSILMDKARRLADSGYVGSLCGCWLELLLLIPEISRFNSHGDQGAELASAENSMEAFAKFAALQGGVLSWCPPTEVSKTQMIAGQIYREATLLLLYASIPRYDRSGKQYCRGIIEASVTKALSLLRQLSPGGPQDTTLCWPIAIVGSFSNHQEQHELIKARLMAMSSTISFRNFERTLNVLELMWNSKENGTGPWALTRFMREIGSVVVFA